MRFAKWRTLWPCCDGTTSRTPGALCDVAGRAVGPLARASIAGRGLDMPKKPSRREQLIASILRAGREESRLSVLFRELIARRFGIGVSDGECMDFLMEKGSATAGELAQITGLTTGAITVVIQRMRRVGLVTYKPERRDRRRTIVR